MIWQIWLSCKRLWRQSSLKISHASSRTAISPKIGTKSVQWSGFKKFSNPSKNLLLRPRKEFSTSVRWTAKAVVKPRKRIWSSGSSAFVRFNRWAWQMTSPSLTLRIRCWIQATPLLSNSCKLRLSLCKNSSQISKSTNKNLWNAERDMMNSSAKESMMRPRD